MAKELNNEVAEKAPESSEAHFAELKEKANKELEGAKNKFTAIAIVGVTEDGQFDVVTNVSQYSYIQWLLNKGSFELFIHEKNANAAQASAEVAAKAS